MSDGTSNDRFWITGIPETEKWITATLWILLICFTVHLGGRAFALFDMLHNNRIKNGLIQAPEHEKREWAENTKYYTEVTEDVKKEDDRESRAQITSRAGLLTNELPSNV